MPNQVADISQPQPETVVGSEHESQKCGIMLENRMQCPRLADWITEQGVAICEVHKQIMGDTSKVKPIERKA